MNDNYIIRFNQIVDSCIKNSDIVLIDSEFVKEGDTYYLRAFIDKDTGVTIEDCEQLSRMLSPILDKENFIEESYILEVSSPDLSRPLKKDADFDRNIGELVEIKTYSKVDGNKFLVGTLLSYNLDSIEVQIDDKQINILKSNINLIRPYIEF